MTEAQCRKVLADILEQTNTGERFRSPAVKDWLAEWLASKESSKAETTAIRYRGTVEAFLAHLGERAKRPLSSLTARDVQSFIAARAKTGCAPSTLQVDGKTLRAALNVARRQGFVSMNAAEAVELPQRQSVERGTFAPAEVRMLVDAAQGEWRTCILLGYFTGARLSEVVSARWEDVDMARGLIAFPKTKTGKPHSLPLHPDLLTHLEKLASSDTPGPLMPHLAGVRTSGRRGLSEQFKRIAERTGLGTDMVEGSGKRRVSRRSFHALRHSFVSGLANAGVAPELRMKLSGHTTEAVHRGYSHHELETLRGALSRLPSLSAPAH